MKSALLDQWMALLRKNKKSILLKDVMAAIMRYADAGDWFKRDFIVLVETCLFEHSADGKVQPKVLDNLAYLSKVRDLNWCGYMIKQPMRHRESWEANKSIVYTGPILFLIVSYM